MGLGHIMDTLGNDLLHILMFFHPSYIHFEVCFLKYLIKLVAWSLLIIYHPLFPQWNYFDRFFVCTERVSCNNQVGQQKCIPRTFSRFHRKASSTWLFNSKNVFFFLFLGWKISSIIVTLLSTSPFYIMIP